MREKEAIIKEMKSQGKRITQQRQTVLEEIGAIERTKGYVATRKPGI